MFNPNVMTLEHRPQQNRPRSHIRQVDSPPRPHARAGSDVCALGTRLNQRSYLRLSRLPPSPKPTLFRTRFFFVARCRIFLGRSLLSFPDTFLSDKNTCTIIPGGGPVQVLVPPSDAVWRVPAVDGDQHLSDVGQAEDDPGDDNHGHTANLS